MIFPEPGLSQKSAVDLWVKERSGYAKEQAVLSNLRLVSFVLKSLNISTIDEDMFSIGTIGLIKAVLGFDGRKGFCFSTYAVKSIKNEILQMLRKKKDVAHVSLDCEIDIEDGEHFCLSEIISDRTNIEEEIITKIQINEIFQAASDIEKEVMVMTACGMTQKEIADDLGISQPSVSRMLKRICKRTERNNREYNRRENG